MQRLRKAAAYVLKRLLWTILGVSAWVAIGVALWWFNRHNPGIVPVWLLILFGFPILFLPLLFLEMFVGLLITPDPKKAEEE